MIETAAALEVRGHALASDERVDLPPSYAFGFMHAGAVAAAFTGVSRAALLA